MTDPSSTIASGELRWLANEATHVIEIVEHLGGLRFSQKAYLDVNGPPWPNDTEALVIAASFWLYCQIHLSESDLSWASLPASVSQWYLRSVGWQLSAEWL